MAMNIVSYGLIVGSGTYLRDGWFLLDFSVVLTSWLVYLPGFSFRVSAFRAFRAFRPLRAIAFFKSLNVRFSLYYVRSL